MSDRCAANHAALRLVNDEWNKTLNELNCHLHPLDSLASASRSALKKEEETKVKLFVRDCIAANIIVQMSKLWYRDGKGDPGHFTAFLERNNVKKKKKSYHVIEAIASTSYSTMLASSQNTINFSVTW